MFKPHLARHSRKMFSALTVAVALLALAWIFSAPGHSANLHSTEHELSALGLQSAEETDAHDYFSYRRSQLQSKNGQIPPGALARAIARRQALKQTQGPTPRVAGINSGSWSSLGPGNVGGRARSIVPVSASTVFIGSVGGGIWKTINCCSAATTWSAVNDFMTDLAIGTMILDPTSSGQTLYAGTGEGYFNFDALQGAGVFKSTDGGATWNQLASTAPGGVNGNAFLYVTRLAISPDGATLLAATRDAAANGGIWRSTNGGSNWTQTFGLNVNEGAMLDVAFDPANSSNAVAGTNPNGGFICGGCSPAYYSTDGGQTWTGATGLPLTGNYNTGRVELAYAPSNTSIVYVSIGSNNNGGGNGDIYRSSDGGHSYTLASAANQTTNLSQPWYADMVWVDPTNANTLVVGGLDLYKSTDGGAHVTKISDWTQSFPGGSSPHADHHLMVSMPGFNGTTNKAVMNANDGGIYSTADIYTAGVANRQAGWVNLNNQLGITQFFGVASNSTSGVVVAGAQDNGTDRFVPPSGQNSWNQWFGGDGSYVASDQTDSNYYYGEYVYGEVFRSTNGGVSAAYIYAGGGGGCGAQMDAVNQVGNFAAPLKLDPNNPNTLYSGGLSLWQSTNAKAGTPCWSAIKASTGGNISAIAVAPGNSNLIWVGYSTGEVDMTTNGGGAWTQVDTNIPSSPGTQVGVIVIDPNNNNVVYVGFNGFQANNVWRTNNGGAASSWTNITSNLPAVPVYSFAINPTYASWLYVGTEIGIFATTDTGGTWYVPPGPANGDGPANVSTTDLEFAGNTLLAATHGRGAFSVGPGPGTDVSVDKTGPATAIAGTDATYNITVSNGGPVDAANVALSDTVPTNTTFVSFTQNTGPSFSCTTPSAGGTGTVKCTIATFGNGATATFTLVVHLDPSAPDGSYISNTATISADNDSTPGNNSSTAMTLVVTQADLGIVKTHTNVGFAGAGQVTWHIAITNYGPSDAQNVTMTDGLDLTQTSYVSASADGGGSCNFVSPTVTCSWTTVPFNATVHVDIVANLLPNAFNLCNTASVTSTTTDPGPHPNTASDCYTVPTKADLVMVKKGEVVGTGRTIKYTLSVTNNGGPSFAHGVKVKDALASSTTLISVTTTQGTCSGTTTIKCNLGIIPVNATVTVVIQVKVVTSVTTVKNTAKVSSKITLDPDLSNNTSTIVVLLGGTYEWQDLTPWAFWRQDKAGM